MKKHLLTLSLVTLTLLSGCAKSEAQGVLIKTKRAINEVYKVKKWVSCDYVHIDSKGLIKELEKDPAINESKIKETKDKGNLVALTYTFTTIKNKEILGYSVYNKKDGLTWTTDIYDIIDEENKAIIENYLLINTAEGDYVTKGTLIKKK